MSTITFTVDGQDGKGGRLTFKPRAMSTANGEIITPTLSARETIFRSNEPATVDLPDGAWRVTGLDGSRFVDINVDGDADLKDLIMFSIPPGTPADTLTDAVASWLTAHAADVLDDAGAARDTATAAATAASASESAAGASATAAAGSASGASGSASTASTKAEEASASAAAAASSATAAGSAKTAAESARDAAVAAKAAAESARDETVIAVAASSDWSGAVSPSSADVSQSRWWKRRLTGNATVTLPNGVAGKAYSIIIEVTQDATGGRSLVFKQSGGSQVSWAYGVTPVMSTSPNARDLWTLTWTGSEWIGGIGAQALAIGTGTGV
ncbi:hypothetical protein ACPXB3_16390 [Gordonia sp. DT219]|uniref:hypothetical protein n=1 Tax=Gordonia sp. DT219 TaxID=3416658 RepID=UPI003CE778C4